MSDRSKEGQEARHTPPAPGENAGDRTGAAMLGRDLVDLLAGSPDVDATDLLSMAAELDAAPRRGRGRPQGAPNRKNGEMIAYLEALGHRDPWVTLSLIQTADTMQLAEALGSPLLDKHGRAIQRKDGTVMMEPADPLKVLEIQRKAAEGLMNYHHAKRPQQIELPIGSGYKRPLMTIGELHGNVVIGADGSAAMSVFDAPTKTIENQPLSEADSVRQGEAMPHEAEKPRDNNDIATKSD